MHRVRLISIGLLASSLFLTSSLKALRAEDSTVPPYLNYQSILRDDAGNLITNSFIDLEFKILGPDGQELYQEIQPGVQVVRGAVNLMIGEGVIPGSEPPKATGGLPLTVFDPTTGSKSLQVKIGNNRPGDPVELGMVPYAAWAERSLSVAPNSIGSEEIKNGSIKLEDLAPGITFSDIKGEVAIGQIPAGIATDEELNAHINSAAAHPAAAITIAGPFSFSSADNLQDLIRDLDVGLLQEVANRSLNRNSLSNRLGQEATDRQAAVNAEATNRTAAAATEAATRATADAAEIGARQAADSDLQNQMSQEATNRTAADATEAATRATADNSLSASISGETSARTAADSSEASTRATADSNLQSQMNSHVGASTAHGSDGAIVGMNTLNSALGSEAATRATADSSLQGQITSEASTRATADNGLQGQMNTLNSTTSNVGNIPGTVTTSQVPQYMRPAAFGTLIPAGLGNYSISNAYNVSSASGCPVQVNFSAALPDANYVVMANGFISGNHSAVALYAVEKFPSYITLDATGGICPPIIDLLVFHP